jgi:hypothetical protein
VLTQKQLDDLRNDRYRRKRALKLTDEAGIRDFVNDVGLCMLFPVNGVELPNVYQAVAGFAREVSVSNRDPVIGLTWNTKDKSLSQRWWYYGKLIRSKATLVSLDLFPNFYALSENFGDEDDYLREYEAGTLSNDAKNIYEALLKHGPLHAIELKRKAGLYGDELKGKFDKALTELQVGLKVMPTGVAEAGAWRYAFIYDIVARWLPEPTTAARDITRSDARAAILARHLRNVIYTTPKEIGKTFGWKPAEAEAAIKRAVERGEVSRGALIKGQSDDVLMTSL